MPPPQASSHRVPGRSAVRGFPFRSIRLATFNVLFGNRDEGPDSWARRLPLLRRAIQQARPDLLGLQEVLPSRLDDMARSLGDLALVHGPCRGPARWTAVSRAIELALTGARTLGLPRRSDVTRPGSEVTSPGALQPIAYHPDRLRPLDSGAFWISATPSRPGTMLRFAPTPFLVHWARLESLNGGGTILFLNAHFGHAPWHHGMVASTVAHHVAMLSRLRPARAGSGGDALDVYLVGDFNAWPSSPLLRRLTGPGPGFMDAARAARERTGPPVTFHWGWGSTRLGLTLDYVLARTSLRATRAEVVDVHEGRLHPSDHHLLVVELERDQ